MEAVGVDSNEIDLEMIRGGGGGGVLYGYDHRGTAKPPQAKSWRWRMETGEAPVKVPLVSLRKTDRTHSGNSKAATN